MTYYDFATNFYFLRNVYHLGNRCISSYIVSQKETMDLSQNQEVCTCYIYFKITISFFAHVFGGIFYGGFE